MPSQLNFLLLGAARSGTSAVTEALNCFPAVFCAMEVIHAGENHKAIVFPQSFERRVPLRSAGYDRDSLAALLAAKRGRATLIGNKNPAYDRTLRRLARAMPGLKLVFIYRPRLELMSSWNRRAMDTGDRGWHPGQRGAFGVLSLLAYLRALQQVGQDCLIVPYKAFTADVEGVAARIVRHLGGDAHLADADRAKLGQLQSAADTLRDRRRALLQNEEELLAALEIDALDTLFARETPFLFSEIEGDVRRYRQSLSGRWGEAFIDALVGYDDPEAIRFFMKMPYQPAIRAMLVEETMRSARLRRTLLALPWTLKLRRLLLGQSELAPCERFLRQMRNAG